MIPARQSPEAEPHPESDSLLLAPTDPVFPAHQDGPVFADDEWDLGIEGRASNRRRSHYVMRFQRFRRSLPAPSDDADRARTDTVATAHDESQISPRWLLRAKELAAVLISPHRTTSRGAINAYRVRKASANTVLGHVSRLGILAGWATEFSLPPDLARWDQDDLDDYLDYLRHEHPTAGAAGIADTAVVHHVFTIRVLFLLRDVVTDGGFVFEPWQGRSVTGVVGVRFGDGARTRVIPQSVYQPFLRNLWTVISVFGPDVVAADRRARQLQQDCQQPGPSPAEWLDDPDNRIPMLCTDPLVEHFLRSAGRRTTRARRARQPDLPHLAMTLRLPEAALASPPLAARIHAAVEAGRVHDGGLADISTTSAAGSERPYRWISGLDPATLPAARHFVLMSCAAFLLLFSGMRDSEVQSLKKGCVQEYWGHLTLTGREFKTFRGAQARWVVIEPVAQAARLAEQLTWHDERLVVAMRPGDEPAVRLPGAIIGLVATMNIAASYGALEKVPDDGPLHPRRFRRTFAVTARNYPWMQIGLNWQFKHASHYMTQGYYALNDEAADPANAVATELAEAAVDRLERLYQGFAGGQPLYGKAAPRLAQQFATIDADLDAASSGFAGRAMRHDELRKRLRGSNFQLHPGLSVDCAFGPGGSCGGVEAPDWNRCDLLCVNVVADAAQRQHLEQLRLRLRQYLADTRLPHTQHLLLDTQLRSLETALDRFDRRAVQAPRDAGHAEEVE